MNIRIRFDPQRKQEAYDRIVRCGWDSGGHVQSVRLNVACDNEYVMSLCYPTDWCVDLWKHYHKHPPERDLWYVKSIER